MFKIGEFSKLTQVSIRMLRYYDETGLLKPALIDKFTGYRMYSVEQLPLLHKIIFLRDTGFSGVEIAEVLSHWEQDTITDYLGLSVLTIPLPVFKSPVQSTPAFLYFFIVSLFLS
jgi:DNA-binding transcriptional MerR regulator